MGGTERGGRQEAYAGGSHGDPSWRKRALALRPNGCPAAAPGCEGRWCGGRNAKRGGKGSPPPPSGQPRRRAPPGDLLPKLHSDYLSKRPPVPCSLPRAPALQAYRSEVTAGAPSSSRI